MEHNNLKLVFYAYNFFILTLASFIRTSLQTSILLVIGPKITKILRADTYKKIVKMSV
jgi:hypothetical protein